MAASHPTSRSVGGVRLPHHRRPPPTQGQHLLIHHQRLLFPPSSAANWESFWPIRKMVSHPLQTGQIEVNSLLQHLGGCQVTRSATQAHPSMKPLALIRRFKKHTPATAIHVPGDSKGTRRMNLSITVWGGGAWREGTAPGNPPNGRAATDFLGRVRPLKKKHCFHKRARVPL